MDESGRIMAPPGLEADPDGEAIDPIVDNSSMPSSRSRSGSSRSGTVRRASSANAAPVDQAEALAAEPLEEDSAAATDATATGSDKTVPLPAETNGPAKVDAPVENSAATDDAMPLFAPPSPAAPTVPTPTSAPAPPAGTAASATETRPAAAPYSASLYSDTRGYSDNRNHQGQAAPPPGSPYLPPSSYPRPGWANPEPRAAQPPLGAGPVPSANGRMPSSGPAAGAASTAPGVAPGMASPVAGNWQRGAPADSNRKWPGVQARKQNKRQAMLTLARVEPWSVMKFSFVASVAAFIILWVAVALLYMVLSALGVFDSLQNTVSSVTSSEGSAGTNISHWFSASLILGYTAMLGAFNIVVITAMCTVGSVIYNLIAKLFGGIEVTLRETD